MGSSQVNCICSMVSNERLLEISLHPTLVNILHVSDTVMLGSKIL